MKNESPSNVFDKAMVTVESANVKHNDLFRLARLNVTLVESDTVGECKWIRNQSHCTGLMSLLTSGKADFSTVNFPFEDYDNRELFPNLKISRILFENSRMFMATSQVQEKVLGVNPYDIFRQFPLPILFLNILALIFVILLINYKLISRDKRISFLDALVLHTLRWNRNYVKLRRHHVLHFALLLLLPLLLLRLYQQ